MGALFAWLQATALAATVRDSLPLTSALSATHLLGFTLVTGGALVANLRMLGVVLTDTPVLDVSRPATRGVAIGLAVSITTGLLLFAPRASDAGVNPTFQIKMLFLASAAVFHFTVHRAASRRPSTSEGALKAIGAIGLLLWMGLAFAGCAFILLE